MKINDVSVVPSRRASVSDVQHKPDFLHLHFNIRFIFRSAMLYVSIAAIYARSVSYTRSLMFVNPTRTQFIFRSNSIINKPVSSFKSGSSPECSSSDR